jgi:GTP-binding protein
MAQQRRPRQDVNEALSARTAADKPVGDLAAGEALFNLQWRFLKSVPSLEFLPVADRPEIAFAGRSNVGKSSLINSLVKQRGLARGSKTPGRTQELNYYQTSDVRFYLVDMPGYGFSKAPKEKVDAWTSLIKNYLMGRPTLVRVFLLIDARHGIKPLDRDIMSLLDKAAVSYQAVLTKIDKAKPLERDPICRSVARELERHAAALPTVHQTSSETGAGTADLRAAIAALARF